MTFSEETLAARWDRARMFFDAEDYIGAARILDGLAAQVPEQVDVRLLLARAYYHSAQLGRAEKTLHEVLDLDPAEAYAHLMLGRTLQRRHRHAEATPHLRLASAMTGDTAPAG